MRNAVDFVCYGIMRITRHGIVAQAGESEQAAKNCHCGSKNHCLIFARRLGMLRAMSRIIVLIVGLVWASLLLVSWGTAETPPARGETAFAEAAPTIPADKSASLH